MQIGTCSPYASQRFIAIISVYGLPVRLYCAPLNLANVAATTQNINEEDQAGDHNTAKCNATGLLRGAKCTHFPKQVYLFFVRLVKPIAGQRFV
ncbi:hypothetical protein D0Y50_14355 [Salinimonas sediminis]|uniref:Uncharacterized protein n=1 Tax=Salinimonas sediminis TaxID=2303538 RepID=A0A346NPH1_9ALTE|nr:hypothetical protein D0Y50_14355 [Salinimonas sediminis]